MTTIEYMFGSGDGDTRTWSSRADLDLCGDGTPDAVRLDFDGDGCADDALWDWDGDGAAEIAALDLDDDGILDYFCTDSTGLGTWDQPVWGFTG